MRNIHDCVERYERLLDKKYRILLGRKNVLAELNISFCKKDCFHLMGLQYLTDRPELSHDREKIFDAIKERRITAEQIESSDLYYKIGDRVEFFPLLEEIIDSNDTVFRYNRKNNTYSVIKADYIMQNEEEGRILYVFLEKDKEKGSYYCKSFFPKTKLDYTKNQALWTLLYKEKITISTGERELLYNRL